MTDDTLLKGKLRYEKRTETYTYILLEPIVAHKGIWVGLECLNLEVTLTIVDSYALYCGYVNSKDMIFFYARLENDGA